MEISIYLSLIPVNPTCRRPQFQNDFNLTTDATGVFNSTLYRDVALPVNATVDQIDDIPLSEVQSFKEPALPWYSDQALPFEITVVAANEYGAAASAKLFGVEILNEGWGMSIDDSVNQMQATLVACRSEGTECAVSSYTVGRTTRCRPWAEAPPPSRVRTAPAPSTP